MPNELFPRRARVIAPDSAHHGREGEAVGRDDPRVRSHPQPGHYEYWEVFLFYDSGDGGGHGTGFMRDEVEFL